MLSGVALEVRELVERALTESGPGSSFSSPRSATASQRVALPASYGDLIVTLPLSSTSDGRAPPFGHRSTEAAPLEKGPQGRHSR